jgi:mannose-6-phosphate isomerase-like protein (cupin superfamily)
VTARVLVPCAELTETLDYFMSVLGFRMERISPADGPREVDLGGHGLAIRLVRTADGDGSAVSIELSASEQLLAGVLTAPNGTVVRVVEPRPFMVMPDLAEELVVSRLAEADGFGAGRAGMGYRDLIPSRLGGRFIASHIRIAEGGLVGDYSHYHRIRFQLIYCRRGWVRVAYEDQGDPFVLNPGDCVIQPPEIRHRVLESSAGLEVIEVGCPAEHDTLADQDIELPTGRHLPERDYGGQRFVRHIAAEAQWELWRTEGYEVRRAGVAEATDGVAAVRTIRPTGEAVDHSLTVHDGEFVFFFVLEGGVTLALDGSTEGLVGGDSVAVPSGVAHTLVDPQPGTEILEVTLPAYPNFTPATAGG